MKEKRNFIFANLITLGSLFCAFYSMSATLNENYLGAIYLILLSFLFDALDGKIARLLHSTSDFGKELDSLVDAVSFGVTPAFLFYNFFHLHSFQFGFVLPFLYVACAVLRLARFNITSSQISKKYFIGLPAPAAALGVVSVIFLQLENKYSDLINIFDVHFIVIICLLSILMISNIYYFSFKNLEVIIRRKFKIIIPMLFILLVISIREPIVLFALIFLYIVSGPARSAIVKLKESYNNLQ
jgi:CDP-diacylglycerol--serine O-phosphatidyltransferase